MFPGLVHCGHVHCTTNNIRAPFRLNPFLFLGKIDICPSKSQISISRGRAIPQTEAHQARIGFVDCV